MINKKLFLITTIILIIVSLSTINATNLQDNTTTISHEQTPIKNTITSTTNETTKTIHKNIQTKTKKATNNSNNYEDLYNALTDENADEYTTITLSGEDEEYVITNPITVNETIKNLVIEGNGKTIDGKNQNNFITIKHSCNVTINNITIKNCLQRNSNYGGALYQVNGSLIINNSKFLENSVVRTSNSVFGGAIAIFNTNLSIINSSFEKNSLRYGGRYLTVEGGAIYIKNNNDSFMKIINSNFTSNKFCPDSYTSNDYGVGVYYYGLNNNSIEIENSTFTSNVAEGSYSGNGILYIDTKNDTKLNVKNTTFLRNDANSYSGIYYQGQNNNMLEFDNTTFAHNGEPNTNSINHCAMRIILSDDSLIKINNSNISRNRGVSNSGITIETNNNCSFIVENSIFYMNAQVMRLTYPSGEGQGLHLTNLRNTFINNCTFTLNPAEFGGALYYTSGDEESNLKINNSIFDSNSPEGSDYAGGCGVYIETAGNTSISYSEFSNHLGYKGGAILYTGSPENHFDIDYCNFSSNRGQEGGAIYLESGNVSINNSKFENNTNTPGEAIYFEVKGGAIYSNAELLINNTNFIGNGLPSIFNFDDYYADNGMGAAIYQEMNNLTIDNSNFILNSLGGEMGVIYAQDYLILNHSNFINNIIINQNENYGTTSGVGTVVYTNTNSYIDYCNFVNNHILIPDNHEYTPYAGVIITNDYEDTVCDVTNCVFMNNTPANFVINGSTIILDMVDSFLFDDGYIPAFANVSVYIDDVYDKNYSLERVYNENEESGYVEEYAIVKDLILNEDYYVYTLVISQNENSPNFERQNFYNNTYYFTIPHEYTLSVNSEEEVYYGDNVTIKGELYSTKSDGNKIIFANKQIDLYINNTYIDTTTTNSNGKYEFNYTSNVLGKHNISIVSNKTIYLPTLTNTSIFEVKIRNPALNILVNDTTIGTETNIVFELKDNLNKPVPSAKITFYVNNILHEATTDENGTYSMKYLTDKLGENHITGFYEGTYGYTNTSNTENFTTYKINTTISAEITDKKVGNTTFKVKIVGDDKKDVTDAIVVIYDKNQNIITSGLITETNDKIVITNITSGNYKVNITYTGNETYNLSSIEKEFTILPEANIKINILNNTEENAILEFIVTNERDELLTSQNVNITLPNGTKTTKKTDKNGKITITDNTVTAGNRIVVAEITTSNNLIGTKTTENITVLPDYDKIIEKMNDTINDLTKQLNDSKKQLDDLNKKIADLNKDIKVLQDTVDDLNKTSVITAVPDNGTVGDNKVVVTLDNKMGTPIANAPITVKNSKGETIGTATTDKNGIAVIPVNTQAGTENITITYPGSDKLTPASTTVPVTTIKNNVTLTVDPVEGIIGENITLTAYITDTIGNPVNGGNLVFKLNGKTLRTDGRFDSNQTAWKIQVKDGKVTVTIQADLYLRNTKNLTASYSGSYKYEEAKSKTVTAQIKKRNAKIKVTATPKTQKQYNTIKFTTTLTDTTPNHKNNTAINTNTNVLFKINRKTMKDKEGSNILIKVVNQTATYKYTVPQSMAGVTKTGETRSYNVEAVMVSGTYYPDTRNTATFNVERSPVTININKITLNNKNQLNIKANIKDYKNNNVIGNNTIALKINGKTYVNPKTNKTQTFKAQNGKLNLNNIQVSKNIKIKTVMIVTGERQSYLGQRNETTKIVKV